MTFLVAFVVVFMYLAARHALWLWPRLISSPPLITGAFGVVLVALASPGLFSIPLALLHRRPCPRMPRYGYAGVVLCVASLGGAVAIAIGSGFQGFSLEIALAAMALGAASIDIGCGLWTMPNRESHDICARGEGVKQVGAALWNIFARGLGMMFAFVVSWSYVGSFVNDGRSGPGPWWPLGVDLFAAMLLTVIASTAGYWLGLLYAEGRTHLPKDWGRIIVVVWLGLLAVLFYISPISFYVMRAAGIGGRLERLQLQRDDAAALGLPDAAISGICMVAQSAHALYVTGERILCQARPFDTSAYRRTETTIWRIPMRDVIWVGPPLGATRRQDGNRKGARP